MTLRQSREDLARLQRWMLSVITHPDGVLAGAAAPDAQQQIAAPSDELEQIVARSRNLTAVERLGVYANAYYARLLECLEEEFPALVYALGEETFRGFAFEYLQQYPPRSYTLARLAENFPRFLRETRPAHSEGNGGAANWADFLIDLATLERTYSEVFDSPGVECHGAIRRDELAAISPRRWSHVRLLPVACLRLLELRFPVHEFAAAVRRGQQPTIPSPAPTCLVVTRHNYIVSPRAVSGLEFELLEGLCAGRSVGEVVSTAAQSCQTAVDQLSAHLHEWFKRWAVDGLFIAVLTAA